MQLGAITGRSFRPGLARISTHVSFPVEAVRDLFGVVRAIYAEARQRGVSRGELERIAAIGKELSAAIELAAGTRPGTLGHRAAIDRAERAAVKVGELVDLLSGPILTPTKLLAQEVEDVVEEEMLVEEIPVDEGKVAERVETNLPHI